MNKHLYIIQALFVIGTAYGTGILCLEDKLQWLNICRYIIYILTIHLICGVSSLVQVYLTTGVKNIEVPRSSALILSSCAALLVHFEQKLFKEDFVYLFLAYIVVKFPEMSLKSISYGAGMACSFYEGYLVHVLPSDGVNYFGVEDNIKALEDAEGVLFPVKKLFIVINKSLFCPPDLKEFNRGTDVPHLEAFNTFTDVVKSVAGVRNRKYHNTAYKIYRPAAASEAAGAGAPAGAGAGAPAGAGAGAPAGAAPVCVAAECATPLHTLHKVVNNRLVYAQLADVDVGAVIEEFCCTLQTIIRNSPRCRGKCELIYYDDEDPNQNLAQILLDRIKELEPRFEEKILQRKMDNVIEDED